MARRRGRGAIRGGPWRRERYPGRVRLTDASQVIKSLLTPLARFHVGDDLGFFGPVELSIQQRLELLVART